MTTTKSIRKILFFICCLSMVAVLIVCGKEASTDVSASDAPVIPSPELVVAGNETAISVDPTIYPAADYLLNMGTGEVLLKVDADRVIQPSFAKGIKQVDEYTWEIELHPNAIFWSGDATDAEAVISSLTYSRTMDAKANPFLEGTEFIATGATTIQAVTEIPNIDITLNLSSPQPLIHNTVDKYTYEDIETADYTDMYRIVEFEPAQRMVSEKNKNYWGTKPETQRVIHKQISDPDTHVIAALSGRYHVVIDIPQAAYSQFQNNDVAKIVLAFGAQTQIIYLNCEKESLSDYRVRQVLVSHTYLRVHET